MASRILANLLVAGGSALLRAASQAYRQALVNAQRTGVASEAAESGAAAVFGKRRMTAEEARSVLGVDAGASYEDVRARFERMFESNERHGTFYLQSKVFRARESLETEYDAEEVRRVEAAFAARRAAREAEEGAKGGEKQGEA